MLRNLISSVFISLLIATGAVAAHADSESSSKNSIAFQSPSVSTTQANSNYRLTSNDFDNCRVGPEDGDLVECPTGEVTIGDPLFCWTFGNDEPIFQELQNGIWVSLGIGALVQSSQAWGATPLFSCDEPGYQFEPSITSSFTDAGTKTFRWIVDGEPQDQFDIVFINPAVDALRGQGPTDGEFSAWTKQMSNGMQLKFYAKYMQPGQKVQFMVQNSSGSYVQYAWKRVEAADLNPDGSYQDMQNNIYFIRTLDLKPGKNRVRILVDGDLVWGTKTYSIKDPLGVNVTRSETDRPDAIRGFQIKPIYFLPSDAPDQKLDTNGTILDSLREGNRYLKDEIGREFELDTTEAGSLDVGFVRYSMTTVELEDYFDSEEFRLSNLLEGTDFEQTTNSRKSYVLFVGNAKNDSACGWGDRPGRVSVVLLKDCNGPAHGLDEYYSLAWVHEVFHNLGVEHVNSRCDLMRGGEYSEGNPCYSDRDRTVDKNGDFYRGTDKAGVDITKLRVWKGNNVNSMDSTEVCQRNGEGKFICGLGEVRIGPGQYCWSDISNSQLQMNVNGSWSTMNAGDRSENPWGSDDVYGCSDPSFPYAPTTTITIEEAFEAEFRWIVNGQTYEPFTVHFQW